MTERLSYLSSLAVGGLIGAASMALVVPNSFVVTVILLFFWSAILGIEPAAKTARSYLKRRRLERLTLGELARLAGRDREAAEAALEGIGKTMPTSERKPRLRVKVIQRRFGP